MWNLSLLFICGSMANKFAICNGIEMQNSKNGKKIIFGIILFLLAVSMTGCAKNTRYYSTTQKNIINMTETNDNSMDSVAPDHSMSEEIKVSLNYGFNHYAKFGRYMNIRAEITPLAKKFQGTFQIVMPEQSGGNVIYEKKLEAVEGEKQNIVMDIPMNGSYNQFQYKILGKNNETVIEKTASVNYSINNQTVYIGVLSNQKDGLSYFQGANTKAFYLEGNVITDNYLSLDALDVIVVSDYNINKLSYRQCNSIKEWIKNGGTLVLSPDNNSRQIYTEFLGDTMLHFAENTIPSKITFKMDKGETSFITNSNIGSFDEILPQNVDLSYIRTPLYKSIEKDLYKIQLSHSEPINIALGGVKDRELFQIVKSGLGKIQVFGYDIRLDENNFETIGKKMVRDILENLPTEKKQQLDNEINLSSYNYRILDNIELTSSENLPRVGKYITILFIYILIAGPIVYIVLKKKDKRNLTWIVVPAISILFTMIVFYMGNSTRVKEPYIGYTTMLQMEDEGIAENNTVFSITSPYNKPYEVALNNLFDISAIVDRYFYGSNFYSSKIDYSKYNMSISKESEHTLIKIKDRAAFTPAYFVSKGKTSIEGTYQYKISDTNDAISGNFTNNLGFNLYHSAVLCNGILIYTGDILDGETVELDHLEKEDIPTLETLYSSHLIDKIAGGKLNSPNTDGVRRHNVLDNYIESAIKGSEKSSFFIGFIEDTSSKEVFDTLNYKSYGIKSLKIPLEINQTKDGCIYMNDMSSQMEILEGYYDPTYRYISSDDLILKYTFKPEDKIKSVAYGKRGNREFYNDKQIGFKGEVYFYNYNTKEYDKIFTDREAKEITELSNYLNGRNELLMKVKVKKDARGRVNVTLPMLTVVKEADDNAEN